MPNNHPKVIHTHPENKGGGWSGINEKDTIREYNGVVTFEMRDRQFNEAQIQYVLENVVLKGLENGNYTKTIEVEIIGGGSGITEIEDRHAFFHTSCGKIIAKMVEEGLAESPFWNFAGTIRTSKNRMIVMLGSSDVNNYVQHQTNIVFHYISKGSTPNFNLEIKIYEGELDEDGSTPSYIGGKFNNAAKVFPLSQLMAELGINISRRHMERRAKISACVQGIMEQRYPSSSMATAAAAPSSAEQSPQEKPRNKKRTNKKMANTITATTTQSLNAQYLY